MKKLRIQRLTFYADIPAGSKNEFFVFRVFDYENAIDMAAKFVQIHKYRIRAAWYVNVYGKSMRIDKIHNLQTWQDSQIQYHKRCISILKSKI